MNSALLRVLFIVSVCQFCDPTEQFIFAGSASVEAVASFGGANGAGPYSKLCKGLDGNLYGTTYQGGQSALPPGFGTIFRILPSGEVDTLKSFGPSPGLNRPYSGLVQGADGNLYGAARGGGDFDAGGLFRISTNGLYTPIVTFNITNGSNPSGDLIIGSDGYLYGTTQAGGAHDAGTVFRANTNGSCTTLFSFDVTNGEVPNAGLVGPLNGWFYGTTVMGGASNLGTVFRISADGSFASLFSFVGTNGAKPYGALVVGPDGNLYGTTANGGVNDRGTVFRITPEGVFTLLHSFSGGVDGSTPHAGLLLARDQKLYGVTRLGGADDGGVGRGAIFQISVDGQYSTLGSFENVEGGFYPYGALLQDHDGVFYGTAYSHGNKLRGTVFRVIPAQPILTGGQADNLFSVEWDAWPGLQYQVQMQKGSLQSQWENVGDAMIATSNTMKFSEMISANARFYRVERLTSP